MTTPHRTLQMALDALDAITDDVDGTGLNTMPSFDKALDAITALREALAAPEPEPVALESVHLTRDTKGMCVVRVNGRVAIRDNGDIIDHMATLEWFAAPPAAPAEDHAAPSGGQEAGPQEDRIEAAYWRFDARHKGYSQWKSAPMSERDAFKAEMRNALEAEKVRAEMRLVARGWLRPDTPAAPDHLHDIAEKVAPAAPQADLLTIDQEKALSAEAKTGPFQHTTPVVGNDVQSGETLRLSSKRHAGSTPPAAPAPDGMVMVPRGLLRRLIAGALRFDPILQDNEAIEQAKQLAASPAAPAAPVVPAVPLSCNKVPPGNGYCDHCARGEYEKCRYTTPAAPVVPLTDGQIRQIVRDTFDVVPLPHDITFARAIEAAHGITGGSNAT